MTEPIEHATFERSETSYPEEWGTPAGERFSEQRTAWVRSQVLARPPDGRTALAALAEKDARLLVTLQLAELKRRETCP